MSERKAELNQLFQKQKAIAILEGYLESWSLSDKQRFMLKEAIAIVKEAKDSPVEKVSDRPLSSEPNLSMQSTTLGEANNKPDYETDYDTWLANQIHSLQQGQWQDLDIPHLIEELEGLNKSNERELESYLVVLLAHLLKWEYQPEKRYGSWDASINNSRNRIAKLFKQQKSLKKRVDEFISEAYLEAKEWASKETKLRIDLFPESCPYSVEELLAKDWLPK
jgi:hypothetical protein